MYQSVAAASVGGRLQNTLARAIVVAVTVVHNALLAPTIGFVLPG
jgi:hypothetical protein